MAPPTIAKGQPFTSQGVNRNKGYMMIHAMARTIWYKDIMWNYYDLLVHLNRGIHFAILPDGQVIQHAPITRRLWHARGANWDSIGVELLVEGVYDLGALSHKINMNTSAFHVYPREQYDGLMYVMDHLVREKYVRSPNFNWDVHSAQSKGRKVDPGHSFDITTWTEMLRLTYGE